MLVSSFSSFKLDSPKYFSAHTLTPSLTTGSVAFNSDGRYYENGAWGRLMYGAFSGARCVCILYVYMTLYM